MANQMKYKKKKTADTIEESDGDDCLSEAEDSRKLVERQHVEHYFKQDCRTRKEVVEQANEHCKHAAAQRAAYNEKNEATKEDVRLRNLHRKC